jgi:hypothetical protein
MTEMGVAPGAEHFCPDHSKTPVGFSPDVVIIDR